MTKEQARNLLENIIDAHEKASMKTFLKSYDPKLVPEESTEVASTIGDPEKRNENNGTKPVSFRMKDSPDRSQQQIDLNLNQLLSNDQKKEIANKIIAEEMPMLAEIGDDMQAIIAQVERCRQKYNFWNMVALDKGIKQVEEIKKERREEYKVEKKKKEEKAAKEHYDKLPTREKAALRTGYTSVSDMNANFHEWLKKK